MKSYILNALTNIFLILLLAGLLTFIVNKIQKYCDSENKPLGKEIVIGKDTLIILRYSPFSSSYELSNGTNIDKELTQKILNINQ